MTLDKMGIMDMIEHYRKQGIPSLRLEVGVTKAGSDSTPKLTVESIDNHIYFYSDVDSDRGLALMCELRQLDNKLHEERTSRSMPADYPDTPIWLHIYSDGGDAFMGFAIADAIKALHMPVYSIVEGYAASAATFISMACAERYILPSSFMLIHEVSTFFWGKHKDLEDEKRLLDMWMNKAARFYAAHSKLSEERIREMIIRDWWMDSTEALENGFVDRIMEVL